MSGQFGPLERPVKSRRDDFSRVIECHELSPREPLHFSQHALRERKAGVGQSRLDPMQLVNPFLGTASGCQQGRRDGNRRDSHQDERGKRNEDLISNWPRHPATSAVHHSKRPKECCGYFHEASRTAWQIRRSPIDAKIADCGGKIATAGCAASDLAEMERACRLLIQATNREGRIFPQARRFPILKDGCGCCRRTTSGRACSNQASNGDRTDEGENDRTHVLGPGLVTLSAAGLLAATAVAAEKTFGPDAKKLADVRQRAINYLKTSQADDGTWTSNTSSGVTALAVTGLIDSGVPLDDPTLAKGLKALEKFVQKDGGIYAAGHGPQELRNVRLGNGVQGGRRRRPV